MSGPPYRGRGLRRLTYLKFDFSAAKGSDLIRIESRARRQGSPRWEAARERHKRRLDVHSRIYNIPGRWNARQEVASGAFEPALSPESTSLEAVLFHRAMGYLRGAELGGALNAEAFLSQLDTLVGDLYENDLNLYPDTVALVWWLAAQAQDLAERNQEGTGDRSPFLQVVNQTYTQWKNQEGELSSLGRRLRKVLEQQG